MKTYSKEIILGCMIIITISVVIITGLIWIYTNPSLNFPFNKIWAFIEPYIPLICEILGTLLVKKIKKLLANGQQ